MTRTERPPFRVLALLCAVANLSALCPGGTGPEDAAELDGTWAGRANGAEIADFRLTLGHAGSRVTGTGEVSFPGDGNRFPFTVTGEVQGIDFLLQLQLPPSAEGPRPTITYAGNIDGSSLNGRLDGGKIQHDEPFRGTDLRLERI